jgi:hypothetical protein
VAAIEEHCKELVYPDQAERYFQILPPTPAGRLAK